LLETVEIHSEQNGLSKKDLNKNIVEVFFLRQNELQRRINEQLYSNNIYIKDGNYIISDRGKLINNINRLLIKIFNL
jgi:phosphomevalonate kinase